MHHSCRALVMHCMDFRFGKRMKEFLEEQGLLGDADLVVFAGAAKNVIDSDCRTFALRQVELSRKLHGATEVHLVNHTDCGAYGGRKAFVSDEEERDTIVRDMEEAARILKEQWPDLVVRLWIARIAEGQGDRTINFEAVS